MQLRCNNCHKPFAISKDAVHAILDEMTVKDMNHYNVACPHCRKMRRVSFKELRRSAPTWQRKEPTES